MWSNQVCAYRVWALLWDSQEKGFGQWDEKQSVGDSFSLLTGSPDQALVKLLDHI